MSRFWGISDEESARIRAYVATVTDPDREDEDVLPPLPTEDFGWVTFWTQVHLLQVERPIIFWGVVSALLVVLPTQLLLLLIFHFV